MGKAKKGKAKAKPKHRPSADRGDRWEGGRGRDAAAWDMGHGLTKDNPNN